MPCCVHIVKSMVSGMEKILFKGIMPALPTPVDSSEKLKKGVIEQLMDFDYAGGVNGFYVCGATGEGPALPVKTRMETLEAVIAHNNERGKIIAHIGGPNFTDVKKLIAHAEKSGADAISSMAPNAYYSHKNSEIVNYYKKIASLTSLPVVIYVTPLLLGNDLTKVFEELMSVDNIIGLKFTLKDYYLMSMLKMINSGNINIINGPDEMLLAGLAMGADGGIGSTYNVMPHRYVALYNAFIAGDIQKARQIQYDINKVVSVLIKNDNCFAAVKATLTLFGIDMGSTVFPGAKFSKQDMQKLKHDLQTAGLEI